MSRTTRRRPRRTRTPRRRGGRRIGPPLVTGSSGGQDATSPVMAHGSRPASRLAASGQRVRSRLRGSPSSPCETWPTASFRWGARSGSHEPTHRRDRPGGLRREICCSPAGISAVSQPGVPCPPDRIICCPLSCRAPGCRSVTPGVNAAPLRGFSVPSVMPLECTRSPHTMAEQGGNEQQRATRSPLTWTFAMEFLVG